MLIQPAAPVGCEKSVMLRCCVSSGKLNVGCVQGDGHTPWVTVFSSSSKNVRLTVGSLTSQSPPAGEERHTRKLDVIERPRSNQRAAHLRPRGSRWSPKPASHGALIERSVSGSPEPQFVQTTSVNGSQ